MPQIHFVREQAYLAGVDAVHESTDCLTHIAEIHHPAHGPGRYYLKHYLEGPRGSKGLANEVCGYILAEAVGLPVPDQALILELPTERIVEMHPQYGAQIRDAKAAVWATLDVGGRPLPRETDLAAAALRAWTALPDLIAFDSWVVVPDRSAANLARRRNKQLVVIDHGHLGGSICWEPDMLPTDEERRHGFLDLWGGRVPDEVNQSIIVAAEGHEARLEKAMPELNRFMESLLDSPRDRIALLQFLQERANSSPARMKRVLRMLA